MSRTAAEKTVPICESIRCDRCENTVHRDDEGFHNFVALDFDAGWGSALGDGNHIELDLCHTCVKEVLGRWLKVSAAQWAGGPKRIALLGSSRAIKASDLSTFFEAGLTISDDLVRPEPHVEQQPKDPD